MPEISVEQFQRLSQQIYQKLGLYFDERKIYFLKKRIEKRMEVLGIEDPRDYVFMVSYADKDGAEANHALATGKAGDQEGENVVGGEQRTQCAHRLIAAQRRATVGSDRL